LVGACSVPGRGCSARRPRHVVRRPRTGSSPTIPQVAERAGVSRATAGRVLGGYGVASADARARVLEAAAALGYQANGLARSMVTGRTDTIGLVIADIDNPFFSRLTRSFCDVCHREGFRVVITNTDEDPERERDAFRVLRERRVDGIAIAPAQPSDLRHVTTAGRQGVPLVLVDRGSARVGADSVVVDNFAAARETVRYLTGRGHRRIAVFGTNDLPEGADLARQQVDPRYGSYQDRLVGYAVGLAEAGLEVRPEYICRRGADRETAHDHVDRLFALEQPPSAVFVGDGAVTLWVAERLQALGIRWPDDVSLVGFDDVDWAAVVRPRLTVVAQPVAEMGQLAATSLIERVRGDTRRARHHVLPTHLIERESVSAPAGSALGNGTRFGADRDHPQRLARRAPGPGAGASA
ncbi:MAG: LacI family DNA-binding transcriptional regulator, partial [Acidimicrobiales bacterium]